VVGVPEEASLEVFSEVILERFEVMVEAMFPEVDPIHLGCRCREVVTYKIEAVERITLGLMVT
jgi:hypothetical protein